MTRQKTESDNPICYQFDGKGGATTVSQDRCKDSGTTVWVPLDYSLPFHRDWLRQFSSLDHLVIEALLAEDTRPRTTLIGKGLLIALRGVNLNPGADPEDMVSVRIWIDENRIVTTRRRDLLSINDIINHLENGEGPVSTADFVTLLADRLVWRMTDTIEGMEDKAAELEENMLEGGQSSLRFELASLRRQAITLRRYLSPQREALGRLVSEKVEWIDDAHRMRIREITDRLIRDMEDLDAVRERAAVSQEELLSRLSEQLNQRMYVLSIVAAIFLPLGFLTGLLGINVGGMPGSDNPQAFWIFSALLLIAVVMQLLVFRWKKWL
ncbi:MAG: zinc transporter ZntB [Chromatiales bacterium]|jgi:zinc transporter